MTTPQQVRTRDVTDYATREIVPRQLTPAPVYVPQQDFDEPMNEVNFEFSDIELEVEEQIIVRTRSQSKAKENSEPPAEPFRKQKKVKRAAKKHDPDYKAKPHRRRPLIEEEPEPNEFNTDDE